MTIFSTDLSASKHFNMQSRPRVKVAFLRDLKYNETDGFIRVKYIRKYTSLVDYNVRVHLTRYMQESLVEEEDYDSDDGIPPMLIYKERRTVKLTIREFLFLLVCIKNHHESRSYRTSEDRLIDYVSDDFDRSSLYVHESAGLTSIIRLSGRDNLTFFMNYRYFISRLCRVAFIDNKHAQKYYNQNDSKPFQAATHSQWIIWNEEKKNLSTARDVGFGLSFSDWAREDREDPFQFQMEY